MSACACKEQCQFRIVLFPYQEPIGFKMAFPTSCIITRQFMWSIGLRQLSIHFKQTDSLLQQFHIISPFATSLRILTESLCHSDFVHTFRCLMIGTFLQKMQISLCAQPICLPLNEENCLSLWRKIYESIPPRFSGKPSTPCH